MITKTITTTTSKYKYPKIAAKYQLCLAIRSTCTTVRTSILPGN